MTAQLFTPGQEVICVEDNWIRVPQRCRPTGATPKKNEIYHVDVYWPEPIKGKWYFSLREFSPDFLFQQTHFAPVMPQETLEENLSEIFYQPITII